ncbi:hypothetical protein [Oceanobacillus sp. CFH 90083]|uniref:hypothetical protein n=1 Tax=Oceanobacillus sp. CFH 90083 TaxID=2592336 RepID=UPI00351A5126
MVADGATVGTGIIGDTAEERIGKFKPVYQDDSLRPSRFKVEYTIEGEGTFKRLIENSAGGN